MPEYAHQKKGSPYKTVQVTQNLSSERQYENKLTWNSIFVDGMNNIC